MSYYIYKYVQNGQIDYIGQTTDLNKRIKDHTKDKLKHFNGQIYYFECKNKTEMDSWEYFLIQKYHPRYNITFNNTKTIINIDEPKWELYMDNSTKIVNILDFIKPQETVKNPKIIKEDLTTKVIYDPRKSAKTFRCYHCGAVFETTHWYKTKTKYGARCPCCPYVGYSNR